MCAVTLLLDLSSASMGYVDKSGQGQGLVRDEGEVEDALDELDRKIQQSAALACALSNVSNVTTLSISLVKPYFAIAGGSQRSHLVLQSGGVCARKASVWVSHDGGGMVVDSRSDACFFH